MNTTLTNSTLNVLDDKLTYVASVLLMCVQIINFSLCVPLNVYVIFIFGRAGGLDAVFTLSQSVSEILFAFSVVQYILCVVDDYLYFVKSLGFFVGLFITARPIFQCCVCWERYLAVVHPLTFLKLKPLRYRLACLIMVWTFVLFCCIYAMLTFPDMKFNFFGSLYLIILVVELFCCVSVLKVLRQPGPGNRREESGKRDSKNKAFEVVFNNLVTFLIQTIPIAVVFSLRSTFMLVGIFSLASAVSVTINIGAGFIQMLFYLHKAGKLTFPRCT